MSPKDQDSYRNINVQFSEKQAGWDRASPVKTWIGQNRSYLLQTSFSKLQGHPILVLGFTGLYCADKEELGLLWTLHQALGYPSVF